MIAVLRMAIEAFGHQPDDLFWLVAWRVTSPQKRLQRLSAAGLHDEFASVMLA